MRDALRTPFIDIGARLVSRSPSKPISGSRRSRPRMFGDLRRRRPNIGTLAKTRVAVHRAYRVA